ncbi:ASCH domain-containing protein [Psychromonas sp. MB-3u-54]|uniref:N(4)-acetylcytidine aminohydrolase n=1 Tax=Psychromonas sp. MB-3u-54 TaxID=2058319 RepID=UPI000C347F25|nr:N(4)-acetylcytidine aminohydrolase [Psychromonas sp. MB-3u-54]PKH01256.1 ASCH domain-containing protein [Psychromonas sp. MB-3u-54]
MTDVANKITFFEFLTPLIRSGKKTITIRDKSENHYLVGSQVEVFTLETDHKVCNIEIVSVEPIGFDEINEFHAQQEYLTLPRLKALIKEIYPHTNELFVITYKLMPGGK